MKAVSEMSSFSLHPLASGWQTPGNFQLPTRHFDDPIADRSQGSAIVFSARIIPALSTDAHRTFWNTQTNIGNSSRLPTDDERRPLSLRLRWLLLISLVAFRSAFLRDE